MKQLRLIISKTELYCNVLSPNFQIHVYVIDLYIPKIGLSRTDHGNIYIPHR
jgi:hypothetical protein